MAPLNIIPSKETSKLVAKAHAGKDYLRVLDSVKADK